MSRFTPRNLVDLVKKNNARVLDSLNRRARHLVHVDETFFLFLHQVFHRFVDAHLATLRTTLKEIAQHVFHVDAHLLDSLWPSQLDDGKIFLSDFELDETVVELAAAQLRAQLFARALKLFVTRRPIQLSRRFFTRIRVEVVETGT